MMPCDMGLGTFRVLGETKSGGKGVYNLGWGAEDASTEKVTWVET